VRPRSGSEERCEAGGQESGERLLSSFGGFDAEVLPPETILRGSVEDQAALHGVLQQIEALGLELVEVRQVDAPREPSVD